MQRICVFAGANKGVRSAYVQAAQELSKHLLKHGLGLVYGGASIGLMGVLADDMLGGGGEVIGVMPRLLTSREIGHPGLSALHEVETMHERKALMAELADGFIALPGGFGTLDELFEILTWAQLGLHGKPVGLLNIAGYFDPLLAFLQQAVHEGFVHASQAGRLLCAQEPGPLLEQLLGACPGDTPAQSSRWIGAARSL
ncbi:MAG TPA: TIGR00730 family Rossman fold protein [Ktedonobacteraceae bacterium]|jgi:hypothetical protein